VNGQRTHEKTKGGKTVPKGERNGTCVDRVRGLWEGPIGEVINSVYSKEGVHGGVVVKGNTGESIPPQASRRLQKRSSQSGNGRTSEKIRGIELTK